MIAYLQLWTLADPSLMTPYLFAGASGAVAVAATLTAAALWRRGAAHAATARRLKARFDADLTAERVFLLRHDRLAPASTRTESYVRDVAGDAAVAGKLSLRAILGEESTRSLAPRIRALLNDGAVFSLLGRDAIGDPFRFVGQTVGAVAVLRLWPMDEALYRAERDAEERPVAAPDDDPHDEAAASREPDIDRWRAALDEAPIGVVVLDQDARVQGANSTAMRLWRLAPDFLAGRPTLRSLLDALRAAERTPQGPDSAELRARVLADPLGALNGEDLWLLPNGDVLRVSASPAPNGGMMIFVGDETSTLGLRRRYNTALDARREMIAALKIGLVLFGSDGKLQVMNPAFATLWRLDEALCSEDSIGAHDLDDITARAVGDEADAEIWSRINDAARPRPGASRTIERFTVSRTSGQRLSVQVTPLPDGATMIDCVDVTVEHEAESALRQRTEALEAVDKLKSGLLNDVAYQLRTPLNAVIGFSDMLRQGMAGPLNARQSGYLDNVLRAAGDLRERIQDALDLGALEAGAAHLERAEVNLNRVAHSLAAVIDPRAKRLGARLELATPDVETVIMADETRLKHALFAAAGAVTSAAASGDRLLLSVASGADGAVLELRLDRFAKPEADLDLEASPEGGGVALSLARRIVDFHDGDLSLADTETGLRLAARLPLAGVQALAVGGERR